MGLRLQIAPDVSISQVSWTISNPTLLGGDLTGAVDVSQSSTIQFLVGGLPQGSGYTITLAATTSSRVECIGSAPFSIVAGAVADASVDLVCGAPGSDAGPTGSVNVGGTVTQANPCPTIAAVSASPSSVGVGGAMTLSAQAVDGFGSSADLDLSWSVTGGPGSGTFDDTTGSSPTFTCTSVGAVTIAVSATAPDAGAQCSAATASFVVTCTQPGGPVLLAANQSSPQGIAVDATNAYWANDGLGLVQSVPLTGGSPITLAAAIAAPTGIAIDATSVYVSNNDSIMGTIVKVPKGGGAAVTLASGQVSPEGIAVNASSVYWATESDIMTVPIGGGIPAPLVSSLNGPTSLAIDATNLYVLDFGPLGEGAGVEQAPIQGGASVTLATGTVFPFNVSACAIAVDATSVYWVDNGAGTVMKVPIGGGTAVTLADGQGRPAGIAVDETNVYWTNNLGGTVMRVPIGGGSPVTVASGQFGPVCVALDAANVYWTSEGGVFKVAKP